MSDDDSTSTILASLVSQACTEGMLSTLEALASELGVSEIQGVPIRVYFAAAVRLGTEQRIAAFADSHPNLGTELLARMKKEISDREKRHEADEELYG